MNLSINVNENFKEFKYTHEHLFRNKVINSFFNNEQNIELLIQTLAGQIEAYEQINMSFRRHYFNIRFTGYLSSTIKYSAIDYMRKNKRYTSKNHLIYDQPASYESGIVFGELLQDISSTNSEVINNPEKFRNSLNNDTLARAFDNLTDKQRYVLTMYYSMGYQDTEMSKIFNVSQQAVQKLRNSALKKLKISLIKSYI